MTIDGITAVCFIGAGTMGRVNAAKAALSGYAVTLYDVNEQTLAAAPERLEEIAQMLAASGYCGADDIPAALARVTLQPDLQQAVAAADLVSESVFEHLDLKRQIHQQLDALCPPYVIVTSNSSYLLPSQIEQDVQHRERFAALHSYIASPLVDIVGGSRTRPQVIETLRAYVKSLGGIPLVLNKEHHGYLLNAMLGPVLATAKYLLIEEGASCEEVDRAWMQRYSAPMGPLGIMDLIGLGLIHDSWLNREDGGPIPGLRPRVLALLAPYIERGDLGMQSGRGFYPYPEAAYLQDGFLSAAPWREDLCQHLELALLASALAIAGCDVAGPATIDRAWKVGMSLQEGPFEILAKVGVGDFMLKLGEQVAAGRFDPDKARLAVAYLRSAGSNRR